MAVSPPPFPNFTPSFFPLASSADDERPGIRFFLLPSVTLERRTRARIFLDFFPGISFPPFLLPFPFFYPFRREKERIEPVPFSFFFRYMQGKEGPALSGPGLPLSCFFFPGHPPFFFSPYPSGKGYIRQSPLFFPLFLRYRKSNTAVPPPFSLQRVSFLPPSFVGGSLFPVWGLVNDSAALSSGSFSEGSDSLPFFFRAEDETKRAPFSL